MDDSGVEGHRGGPGGNRSEDVSGSTFGARQLSFSTAVEPSFAEEVGQCVPQGVVVAISAGRFFAAQNVVAEAVLCAATKRTLLHEVQREGQPPAEEVLPVCVSSSHGGKAGG